MNDKKCCIVPELYANHFEILCRNVQLSLSYISTRNTITTDIDNIKCLGHF